MPIAAVPGYLGGDFGSASPGLRFGMYLKLWGVDSRSKQSLWTTHDANYRETGRDRKERRFEDENKTSALDAAAPLSETDRRSIAAHVQRQRAIFNAAAADGLELMAKSVAPFTTGLGNEHPLENGFAFLNPYGLPYLPGSGVKGVVRRAAEELAHSDFFENDTGWTLPAIWNLFGFEPWLAAASREPDAEWEEWIGGFSVGGPEVEAYLGAVLDDSAASQKLKHRILHTDDPTRTLLQERHLHSRGALEFWDVVPQIKGNNLSVEIMTPHHSHYYQGKAHAGSTSPHDSGKPTPISFLTVPPGSDFVFHVRCDRRRLARCLPQLAEDESWRRLVEAAFEHAFEWLGFGAKTAVGYGAMELDPRVAEAARRKAEEEAAALKRREEERRRLEAEKAAAEKRRKEKEAFDALPESRKRLIEAERALKVFQEGSQFNKAPLNEAKSQGNRLADEAPSWPDAAEREKAATFLERLYEVIGWSDPGMRTKQKKKQEKKRRDAIARIRDGG